MDNFLVEVHMRFEIVQYLCMFTSIMKNIIFFLIQSDSHFWNPGLKRYCQSDWETVRKLLNNKYYTGLPTNDATSTTTIELLSTLFLLNCMLLVEYTIGIQRKNTEMFLDLFDFISFRSSLMSHFLWNALFVNILE